MKSSTKEMKISKKESSYRKLLDQIRMTAYESRLSITNRLMLDGDIHFIANFLVSGESPSDLKLELYSNQIPCAGAEFLANSLQNHKCPAFLELDLSCNYIKAEGAKAFAELFRNGNYPKIFKLNLSFNFLTIRDIKNIGASLSIHGLRSGFELNLSNQYKSDDNPLEKKNRNMRPNQRKIDYRKIDNDLKTECAITFGQLLASDKCGQNIVLNLSGVDLGDMGSQQFVYHMRSGKFPTHLTLNLMNCGMSYNAISGFANALKLKQWPAHLSLNIAYNIRLSIDDIKEFKDAVESVPFFPITSLKLFDRAEVENKEINNQYHALQAAILNNQKQYYLLREAAFIGTTLFQGLHPKKTIKQKSTVTKLPETIWRNCVLDFLVPKELKQLNKHTCFLKNISRKPFIILDEKRKKDLAEHKNDKKCIVM